MRERSETATDPGRAGPMDTATGRIGPVEWATASRPMPGEELCGDHAVVLDIGGWAVFGAIDGLGHGAPAYRAAQQAGAVLRENPAEPLDVQMLLCHRALAGTRGAAVTLAAISYDGNDELCWLGVGNVNALLIEASPGGPAIRAGVLLPGGIVGFQLPGLPPPQRMAIRPGDLLLMVSDGIRGDIVGSVDLAKSAEQIAADLFANNARDSDDALVLAARHRGTPP